MTQVKNQGNCNSCWAFSAIGALESQHFLKNGKLMPLSEQNLIDCSSLHGCNNGYMNDAFQYIKDNGGINSEKSYTYKGINGICKYNPNEPNVIVRDFISIPEGDEVKLKDAIATIGPISVAIDSSHESFRHYYSGVYSEIDCNSQKLDHAVLVVGYGSDLNGGNYYIVKNSWGDSWGDNGYIKMVYNQNNHCGIATVASFPLV